MSDFDWKADLRRWLSARCGISSELTDSIIMLFERAFKHTRCPQRAWFGVHPSCVSLVIGGIYLAEIQRSGQDQGLWLLIDQQLPSINNIEYQPAKSTQRSRYPLIWAHSVSLTVIPSLIINPLLWDWFAVASEKILVSLVASDRDSVQERRRKKRLSDFWFEEPIVPLFDGISRKSKEEIAYYKELEEQIKRSRELGGDARRKELKTAPKEPEATKILQSAFKRNPDVIVEILEAANGFCEACGNPAPFIRDSDDTLYLEVHHKAPLAEGGEDTVENAIALCPNCHRKMHFGKKQLFD